MASQHERWARLCIEGRRLQFGVRVHRMQVVVHSVSEGGESARNAVRVGDRLLRIVRPGFTADRRRLVACHWRMQQRPLLRSVPSQGSETAEGLTHDRAGALIKTPARPLELVFVRGADTYTVTYQDANLGMMLGNTVRAVRPFEATAARGVRVGLELHRTGRHSSWGRLAQVVDGLPFVQVQSVAAGGQSARNAVRVGDRILQIVRPPPLTARGSCEAMRLRRLW